VCALQKQFGVSERRACVVVGQARGNVNLIRPQRDGLIWPHLAEPIEATAVVLSKALGRGRRPEMPERDQGFWSGGLAPRTSLGCPEAVGLGAGLDDVCIEREPVDDCGDKARIGDDVAPFAEREI
jgi:hypothetical protein